MYLFMALLHISKNYNKRRSCEILKRYGLLTEALILTDLNYASFHTRGLCSLYGCSNFFFPFYSPTPIK